ncbi:hypothetical protein RRG08_034992 [Elysia crispata]|uniref:Uncharacterized protein n=1 Tax=Elysia crispata TaxID=231223 RepID=A0AAE0Y3K4_9GAST|nr:hypothetical protein RRG08_034992 [Elysia crispata]
MTGTKKRSSTKKLAPELGNGQNILKVLYQGFDTESCQGEKLQFTRGDTFLNKRSFAALGHRALHEQPLAATITRDTSYRHACRALVQYVLRDVCNKG